MDDFVGLIWWCVLTFLAGYIGLKSGKLRFIIDGEPTILIKRGKIIRKALKLSRVNIDDVSMMLRTQNIFSITDVEYALLEPNGNLSVMKKQPQQQITKSDMKIPGSTLKHLPSEWIVLNITKGLLIVLDSTGIIQQLLRVMSGTQYDLVPLLPWYKVTIFGN